MAGPKVTQFVQGAKSVAGIAKDVAPVAALGFAAYKLAGLKPPQSSLEPAEKDLTFPNDLISSGGNTPPYMSFRFSEYRRRSIFESVAFTSKDSINLPIPNNLVDTTSVTYGEEGADAAAGAAIEGALQGKGAGGGLAGIASGLAGSVSGIAEGLALEKIKKAAGDKIPVNQVLQMGGVAQNPFLTVLFKSPTFKQHQFSWKLAPNNASETEKLKKIITIFKRNMLPAMAPGNGGTLLTYPNIVEIAICPTSEYLYEFKPCVIESMSVNFAPANTPSFFKENNAPVEVQISLQLKEIEYWLQEDIVNPALRSQGK